MDRPLPSREFLHLGEAATWLGFRDTRPLKAMIRDGLPVIEITRKTRLISVEDLRTFLAEKKRRTGDDTDRIVSGILEGF